MKKNTILNAVGKTNGILRLLLVMLSASLSLCAEPSNLPEEELDESLSEIVPSKELTALETGSFIRQPMEQQEMQRVAPVFELPSRKNSFLAVGLTFIMPGLGHLYLGDMKTAGSLVGSTGMGCTALSLFGSDDFIQSTSFLTLETTWLYAIYAAYRDVRLHNRQAGYSYKMPTDSFLDLTAAPFNVSILKKPEVWGGLLGGLALAIATAYIVFPEEKCIHSTCSLKEVLSLFEAFPIGVGEEAFFRGFLQSQFSEWSTPWGGIILSSLIFGLMHMPNGWDLEPKERRGFYTFAIPLITASGIYDGWLTYKNHSLKESVAIHAWYDFVLFAISTLAEQAVIKGRSEFVLSIPF